MKPKNKIKRWASLAIALFFVGTSFAGVYSAFAPQPSSAAGADGAYTIYNNHNLKCSASISVSSSAATLAANVLRTNGDGEHVLGALAQGGYGSAAEKAAAPTFSAILSGSAVLAVSFYDLGDPGGSTSSFAPCNQSIAFFRLTNASDKNTFYGIWKCASAQSDGYQSSLCNDSSGYYKVITGTVNPTDKTISFSWPGNGGSDGTLTSATLSLADPNNTLGNSTYFGTGGGSTSAGQSLLTCLQANLNEDINPCLAGRTAKFIDTADILFENEIYHNGSWQGDNMTYSLVPSTTNKDLSDLQPSIVIDTKSSEADLNIDSANDLADGVSQVRQFGQAISHNYTISARFNTKGSDSKVNVTTGTGAKSINQVAVYYPDGADGTNDIIQLVLSGPGKYEAPYFGAAGQYTRPNKDTSTFTIKSGGFTNCTTQEPRFLLDTPVTAAMEDGTHTVTAHWILTASGSPCDDSTSVAVTLAVAKSGTTPPDNSTSTCTDKDANGNCKNSNEDTLDCGAGAFNWIICFGIQVLQTAANQLDSLIMSRLDVKTDDIFKNGDAAAYKQAWDSFRVIAIAVLVIAGIVMVASQALGFEFLDAYTIRKVLPRILIAGIGISLSWPLLQFVINFFNVVGYDIRGLIYAPFEEAAKSGGGSATLITLGNPLTILVAGGALFLAYGPAIFTFLITALLALLIALLILVVRQIAIIVLVILAPVAIACFILPNTQKVWKLWVDNFMGLMLMFPIISALIAAGHVMSAVGRTGGPFEQFVSIIAYFIPYFLLPFAFRVATGAISTIAGFVNDKSKGAFDRLKKTRSDAVARNMHDLKTGNRFKGDSAFARRFNATSEGIASIPSAGFNPKRMRSRMQAARSRHQMDEAAEFGEKSSEFGVIKQNDDLLNAGIYGKGKDESVRQYLRDLKDDKGNRIYSDTAVEQGVAAIRAARRSVNSEVFETAATMALPATGTAFKYRQKKDEDGNLMFEADGKTPIMTGGAGEMNEYINKVAGDDRVKATRMLAAMRSGAGQARRFDINGGGFGAAAATLEAQYQYTQDPNGPGGKVVINGEERAATVEAATKVTVKQALEGQGGSYVAGARKNAVQAFAPEMLENLTTIADSGNIVQFRRELAKLAGRYDAMSQSAPENAEVLANEVLAKTINGRTVLELIEANRDNTEFLEMRKEFGRNARAGAQQADYEALQRSQPQGQPIPPVQPPPGG